MNTLLFTYYSLSSTDCPKEPHGPRRDHHTTGSPTASRLQRTHTPKGSEGCQRRPLSHLNSWEWQAMLPPVSSTSWMTMTSDGSSIGDMAPSHRPSRECTMADALGHPPAEAESSQTRTSPCSRTETPELTREHGEALRQQWLRQPPTAPARSAHHIVVRAHGPTNGARGRTHQVQHNTTDRGTNPP